MTTIPDDELLRYAPRAKGKVVLITGAANGIGKETALLFAKYGAKVAVGDINEQACQDVAWQISQSGGEAFGMRCDVTSWDEQVRFFDEAYKRWDAIDVVIPNAGISEAADLETVTFKNGKPVKPNLLTADVNLTGVLYTVHLGLHYLKQKPEKSSMRAIVLLGSMASWQSVQGGPVYAATKHGMLGLMRSLYESCRSAGIRVGTVHPWFAETNILTDDLKLILDGIPKVPLHRVASTIFFVATNPEMNTSGYVWMLPDGEPLLQLAREQLQEGVYKMMNERLRERIRSGVQSSMMQKSKL